MVPQIMTGLSRAASEERKVSAISKAVLIYWNIMAATVYRPLNVVTFNSNGIGRQSYELRKQMRDLKIDVALLSETLLKPQMRFYIPDYHISERSPRSTWGRNCRWSQKGNPRTHIDLPPLLSVEATGISIPIGLTEMLITSVYKWPLRAWRNADIAEILKLRMKSNLAGNVNAKRSVWNSVVPTLSGLKLEDLFVTCNLEVSMPQNPTRFVPNGRC
jgi:hypothetical protein